jgi:hypothetical protein
MQGIESRKLDPLRFNGSALDRFSVTQDLRRRALADTHHPAPAPSAAAPPAAPPAAPLTPKVVLAVSVTPSAEELLPLLVMEATRVYWWGPSIDQTRRACRFTY